MSGTLNRWGHYFLGLQYFDLILAGRLIPKPEDSFRSHLVWAKRRDVNLKALITGRCLTSTVVLSLMVSTDVAIIYSPSKPADVIRDALENERVDTLAYWVGITVCVSLCISVCALMANFTARTTFNSLSKENAPIILRSSIGLYAASIPQRLLVHSIYIFFLLCLLSFWEIANPTAVSMTVSLICVALFVFVIISFTSISRLIMLNGAMGHDEILSQDKEEKLSTKQLSDHLLKQASLAKKAKIPINYQYRVRYHQVLEDVEMGRVPVPLQREFLDAQKESKRDAAAMKLKSHSLYKGDFPSSIDYDRDATIIPADFEVEIKAEE